MDSAEEMQSKIQGWTMKGLAASSFSRTLTLGDLKCQTEGNTERWCVEDLKQHGEMFLSNSSQPIWVEISSLWKKKVKLLVAQSWLCDPMDGSPPGSSVHEFSRQEYWSGLPFPSPGDLPNLGIKPKPPALQAESLPSEPPGKPCSLWALSKLQISQQTNQLLHILAT